MIKWKIKTFGSFAILFFTEEGSQYDQNITLIEKKHSISEKHKVVNITKTLNIAEWKPQKRLIFQNLDVISDTFSSQPIVIQIKEKTYKNIFSFCHVEPSSAKIKINQLVAQFQQMSYV